jgi:hypothetical protein
MPADDTIDCARAERRYWLERSCDEARYAVTSARQRVLEATEELHRRERDLDHAHAALRALNAEPWGPA